MSPIPLIEAVLQVAAPLLRIIDTKQSRKYLEQMLGLQRDFYEETKKEKPDFAVLDNIEHELFVLGQTIGPELERQKAKALP